MTTLATAWMLGCVCWICWKLHRLMAPPKGGYTRRRGSNPPAPGRKPAPPAGPPAPGMRREWLWSPSQMAECGGPCWETQDPRRCDCGALWRDVPIRMDEGQTQRGNGNGAPATPKPDIIPKPQFPSPRKIREDFLP